MRVNAIELNDSYVGRPFEASVMLTDGNAERLNAVTTGNVFEAGDVVTVRGTIKITSHAANYGRAAKIVTAEIYKIQGVYVEPVMCVFTWGSHVTVEIMRDDEGRWVEPEPEVDSEPGDAGFMETDSEPEWESYEPWVNRPEHAITYEDDSWDAYVPWIERMVEGDLKPEPGDARFPVGACRECLIGDVWSHTGADSVCDPCYAEAVAKITHYYGETAPPEARV